MAPQPPTSLLVEAYRGCEGLPLVGGLFTRGRVEAKAVLSVIVAAVLVLRSGYADLQVICSIATREHRR